VANPPPSYDGWEKYLFVAYSHLDDTVVHEEIRWLQARGHNVAYDEGINPGSAWSDAIAERIQGCECLIYFVSAHSVVSEHCRRELSFALEENRRILAVHFEPTSVPAGVRLSLNNRQAIQKHALSDSSYRQKLLSALSQSQPLEKSVSSTASSTVPNLPDRIHISLVADTGSVISLTQQVLHAIVRSITWQGGVYRAHYANSRDSKGQHDTSNYLLEVSISPEADQFMLVWQLSVTDSAEVVSAGQSRASESEIMTNRDQIADMIGEGVLKSVTNRELHKLSTKPLETLTYSQLILKAEQLNYLDRREVQDRLAALSRAMEIEPHSGFPHAALAGILSWQIINGISDNSEEASTRLLDEARTALRLDGNDPPVLLSVGTTYCRIGRYESGLSLIRRAYQMAPTNTARDRLARSLCFAGQPEEAIELFEEIVARLPAGYSFPYVRLAIAQAQAGKLEAALENSAASTLNFPDDYYGWYVHANLLELLGSTDKAISALAEGRKLVPQLKVETVIENTASTYGRTEAQREWLTAGLRRLIAD